MKVTVLIPAAGTGSRMGADVNKQYLSLAGRPILAHTLSLFDRHPAVNRIVVISPVRKSPFAVPRSSNATALKRSASWWKGGRSARIRCATASPPVGRPPRTSF